MILHCVSCAIILKCGAVIFSIVLFILVYIAIKEPCVVYIAIKESCIKHCLSVHVAGDMETPMFLMYDCNIVLVHVTPPFCPRPIVCCLRPAEVVSSGAEQVPAKSLSEMSNHAVERHGPNQPVDPYITGNMQQSCASYMCCRPRGGVEQGFCCTAATCHLLRCATHCASSRLHCMLCVVLVATLCTSKMSSQSARCPCYLQDYCISAFSFTEQHLQLRMQNLFSQPHICRPLRVGTNLTSPVWRATWPK